MNFHAIAEILSGLDEKLSELETKLSSPEIISDPKQLSRISREYKRLRELTELGSRFKKLTEQIADDQEAVSGNDPELAQLAQEELPALEEELEKLQRRILTLLVPPDPNEGRPVIVEIRAGTGGNEAALFAADLFRMYSRYAEEHKWQNELIDSNATDLGGYKEIVFILSGDDVYQTMRFESGIHRVQRIPVTESGGRIHTSAASVAVLPEVSDEEIEVRSDDLKIDTFRASGAGGQHVNKTESAIRITHIPTGIVVTCQSERSQHKNRARAMSILKSKIADLMQSEKEKQQDSKRKTQVGSGDRSEKIRTYNFPQNRITDHRIGFTSYNLQAMMEGRLSELFEALQSAWGEEILSKQLN